MDVEWSRFGGATKDDSRSYPKVFERGKTMDHEGINRRDLLKTVALAGLACCPSHAWAAPKTPVQRKGRLRFKLCIDRRLPAKLHDQAMRKAIAENPTNKHGLKFVKGAKPKVVPPDPRRVHPQLAILWQQKWQNGRTLRVRFLDGDTTVRTRVEGWAHKWEAFANIKKAAEHYDVQLAERSWRDLGVHPQAHRKQAAAKAAATRKR